MAGKTRFNDIDSPWLLIAAVDGLALARNGGDGLNGPGPSVCPITLAQSYWLVMNTNGGRDRPSGTVTDWVARPIRISCETFDETLRINAASAAVAASAPGGPMNSPTSPLARGPPLTRRLILMAPGFDRR